MPCQQAGFRSPGPKQPFARPRRLLGNASEGEVVRRLAVMLATLVLISSCGGSEESEPAATNLAPTSAGPSTTPGAAAPVDGDAAELRNLAFAYWEAFNAYDADRVLSFLEPGYRAEREETIRSEVNQISVFGVTLGVTELSPPVMLGPDTAEMFLEMKEPLGTRRIRMGFRFVDGDWLIDFAQQSD